MISATKMTLTSMLHTK